MDNDQFGLRFFPPALARIPAPLAMEAVKPPKTIRVFILGESAALGDPRPNYSAARYMQILLRERFPGRKFEVVNTAMTGINSHAILPIARECAAHEGDYWIIYMGNNEMIGPFGVASASGVRAPPLWLVRTSLAVQQLRIGQLLMGWSRKLLKGSTPASWKGLEMFLDKEVTPHDSRKEIVYNSFRKNLEDILRLGVRSGARVVLNTVAVNLRDCPPFASLKTTKLSDVAIPDEDKMRADASGAVQKGDLNKGKALFEQAARQFPDSADLQFRLADCLLGLGEFGSAEEHFQAAVDLDTLPFRADSRINGLIKNAATRFSGPNLVLCDAAAVLGAYTDTHIPGQESFYEHVHLNTDGNFLLGSAWAREVESLLPPDVQSSASSSWASQEVCEELLGLTAWNRISIIDEMLRRLGRPPLSNQSNNSHRLAVFQSRMDDLNRIVANPDSAPPAREAYLKALQRAPDDPCLHENFAEFLGAIKDLQGAVLEWSKTRDLIPHYYLPHYNLGLALEREGKVAEGREALLAAASLNPNHADIRLELGLTYAREGMWDTALAEFQRAHELNPRDSRELLYTGEALWKLNRRSESGEMLREAIRLQPDYWQAHYRLADELASSGDLKAAAVEFQETIRANPGFVQAHENLGVALFKLGRINEAIREFDYTLRLDPQNEQALEFRRRAARVPAGIK